jgi:hypothetical protein
MASMVMMYNATLPKDTHSFLSVLITIHLLFLSSFNQDNPLQVPGQVSASVVVAPVLPYSWL